MVGKLGPPLLIQRKQLLARDDLVTQDKNTALDIPIKGRAHGGGRVYDQPYCGRVFASGFGIFVAGVAAIGLFGGGRYGDCVVGAGADDPAPSG